jgi:hypothetical protein
MTAAQDQALHTKHHTTKILQTETDSKCQQFDKTMDHTTSMSNTVERTVFKETQLECPQPHYALL